MYRIPNPSEIKRLRKEANLTQKELATLAGVSQPLIARMETEGENRVDPRVSTLKKVLEAISKVQGHTQKAIDIASKEVITIKNSDNVSKAALIMSEKGVSQLIVIDNNNKLVGSIREKTLTRNLLKMGTSILKEKISSYLEDLFPKMHVSSSFHEIKSLLIDNDAILLIDKEKLAGIITKADIIKFYKY